MDPIARARRRFGLFLGFLVLAAVNYGAGLSRVPLPHYTLAVIGGLTPRAFAYGFFGDALIHTDVRRPALAGAGLATLVLIPALFRKRWLKRWQR